VKHIFNPKISMLLSMPLLFPKLNKKPSVWPLCPEADDPPRTRSATANLLPREPFCPIAVRLPFEREMRKMNELPWARPLKVRLPGTGDRRVEGPLSALNVMLNEWPETTGDGLQTAKRSCYRSLETTLEPAEIREPLIDAARAAFIEAAVEAELRLTEE
jgi:hypothetical protein